MYEGRAQVAKTLLIDLLTKNFYDYGTVKKHFYERGVNFAEGEVR